MNKILKIIQVLVTVILIITAIFFIPKIKSLTPEELSELMPDSVTLAAVVLFILFCIKSLIFVIPMILLYICAGLILPPAIAVVFTIFCVTVEMTIGFFTGKKLGHNRVKKIADDSKYAGKLFNKINENVFVNSFLLRLVPVFSLDIVSMIFGAADADYPEFIAGSVLGIIPGLVPVVLAGNSITDPLSRGFLIPFAVFLILSVSCTIIYYIRSKKLKNNCCKKEGLKDEA
ncbi:MAG: TVP38/TMEM64 family protein [Clostridiaceae bacterium]|mgnify:CR=1 FL=1|nr:TVP38/TMEM64 family protein [Clostridiaceae bacterium]